jgi:CHAT domain-containing protein/TPR repeat protein
MRVLSCIRALVLSFGVVAVAIFAWIDPVASAEPRKGRSAEKRSEAVARQLKAAEAGDTKARAGIAYMHETYGSGARFDKLAAYLWYRLAGDAGHVGSMIAAARLGEESYSLPNVYDGYKKFPNDDNKREAYEKKEKARLLEHYQFYPDYRSALPKIATRTVDTRMNEAHSWLSKAADKGSRLALLRLGNLHLTAAYGKLEKQRDSEASLSGDDKSKTRAAVFPASFAEAARYYRMAIDKGSRAARINLASMHEAGLLGRRDLGAAAKLYRGAAGFGRNRALIGLLRLEMEPVWRREQKDWRAAAALDKEIKAIAILPKTGIVIESLYEKNLPVRISDPYGRRWFDGDLKKGEWIVVPPWAREPILWIASRYLVDIYVESRTKIKTAPNTLRIGAPYSPIEELPVPERIRIYKDGVPVQLPDRIPASHGIRLDPRSLDTGKGLLVDDGRYPPVEEYDGYGDDGKYATPRYIPKGVKEKARIVVEAVNEAGVFIRDADYRIGHDIHHSNTSGRHSILKAGTRVHVPDAPGQVLRLRAVEVWKKGIKPAQIKIFVDGRLLHTIVAPPGCVVTVKLDADELTGSKRLTEPTKVACELLDEAAPMQALVVSRAGRVVIGFGREPDERLNTRSYGMKVSATFLRFNVQVQLLQMTMAGRWNDARRAQRIAELWDKRDGGPNGLRSVQSSLAMVPLDTRMGDYDVARKRLDRALAFYQGIGWTRADRLTDLYKKFAQLFRTTGEFGEALRLQRLVLALNEREARRTKSPMVKSLSTDGMAAAYESAGQLKRALYIILYEMLRSGVTEPERADGYGREMAPFYLNSIVRLLRGVGRHALANKLMPLVHYQVKRDIGQKRTPEPFQFPLKLAVFERLWGPTDRSVLLANGLGSMGQVYAWQKRFGEALPLFEQKLRTVRNVFGEGHTKAALAEIKLASVYLGLGRVAKAEDLARRAHGTISNYIDTRLGAGIKAHQVARSLRPVSHGLLQILASARQRTAGAAQNSRHDDEAFRLIQELQSSRAAVALHGLAERLAQSDAGLRVLLRKRLDLENDLIRFDARLVAEMSKRGAPDSAVVAAIHGKIDKSTSALRQLRTQVATAHPKFQQLSRPKPVSIAVASQKLNEDEALLIFEFGARASFVFAVTQQRAEWRQIPLNLFSLNRKVAELRRGLEPRQAIVRSNSLKAGIALGRPTADQFDLGLAHELYRDLIHPVSSIIKDKRHLIVVASGALGSLPLQVLVSSPFQQDLASPARYRTAAWLAKDFEISTLPSVSTLVGMRSSTVQKEAPRAMLGLADPIFDRSRDVRLEAGIQVADARSVRVANAGQGMTGGQSTYVTRGVSTFFRNGMADSGALASLARLPDTADELRTVARLLDVQSGDLLLGGAATESELKARNASGALADYRILYFSTHGLVAGDVEGLAEPALALTAPERPDANDNGLLTASEIASFRLRADWVVLSACNTAAADRPGAEALSGLATSFFQAGAKTLLVSHWPVYSAAAVKLTTRTFSEMHNNPTIGRAAALRKAMLELIDRGKLHETHPGYWAPFAIVGEGGASWNGSAPR